MSGTGRQGAAFKWVYYAAIAAMIVAVACFLFRWPLSYLLAGFDPALQHDASSDAYRAYRATRGLRESFLPAAGYLSALVSALSIVALVMRSRGKLDVQWGVPTITLIVSAILAMLALFGSMVPTGGMLG